MKDRAKETLKFKLNALLGITRAINANQSVASLLASYTDILCGHLKIGKLVMYLYRTEWECILRSGVEAPSEAVDLRELFSHYTSITMITGDTSVPAILHGFDIVMPVYNNQQAVAYVLIGDIDEEMEGISPVIKHLQYIQTISSIIVVAIENMRLFKESLRQEAMKKEMELASQMQNMLVPKIQDLPRNDFIHMTAFYKPHYEVGGDYFDCIPLGHDEIGFCVADVSGKGMAAAILMSNFQATLRALFTADIAMEQLLTNVNLRVYDSAQGEKFITLFVARYNYATHFLEYVNAGHTPVILYRTESDKVELLESSTIAVGMLDYMPVVNVKHTTIAEHSLLLSYTDGMVEVLSDTNANEIDSAFYVLENAIKESNNIDAVLNKIIVAQNLNGVNKSIFDDITLLGIEFFAP